MLWIFSYKKLLIETVVLATIFICHEYIRWLRAVYPDSRWFHRFAPIQSSRPTWEIRKTRRISKQRRGIQIAVPMLLLSMCLLKNSHLINNSNDGKMEIFFNWPSMITKPVKVITTVAIANTMKIINGNAQDSTQISIPNAKNGCCVKCWTTKSIIS